MKKFLCIKKEPGTPAYIGQIGPDQEDMEKYLGGPAARVRINNELAIWYNAEAEEKRLPKSCVLGGLTFRGPIFVLCQVRNVPAPIPATKIMDVMRMLFEGVR